MFRSARWRSEKIRIKEVFNLQFHATQVLQPGVNALTVSLVPADVGKPTSRLQKAVVRDGTCRWENPVNETVKFARDPKTGKINERIYHFVVSSGSSKAGLIGEVTIDFSDYAEATKPSTLSLPLKNSNTVLHVLIRRLQNIDDEREVEETQEVKAKSRNRSLRSHFSLGDMDDSIESNCTEDDPFSKTTHKNELIGNRRASSGSDVTLSSSDTSSGLNTPLELALRNSIQPDPASTLSSLGRSEDSEPMENVSSTTYEEHQKSQWVSSDGSDPGINTDDSMHSPRDTHRQESCGQSSDDEVEKLKAELVVLARQADVTELELQTLRKQIVKESKKGQDLSREVVSLKEERKALEAECEKLKAFQKCGDDTKDMNILQAEGGDVCALLDETRQELNHEKDQNASLRIQLQKTQESNAELILAVRDLDELLEQKDREMSDLWNGSGFHESREELKGVFSKCETVDDEEQKALEDIVKEHKDTKEAYMLEQKIVDLCNELEIYRRDKDELEMQMEHLALDYEILKQENHNMSYKLEQSALQEQLKMPYECSSSFANVNELESKVESLEKELQNKSNEFSDSLATIGKLESRIEGLEEELEKQARGFEADVEALMLAKVEQEQRAIRAEETLRKTRWKNVNAAERIQEEFRSLSTQMTSTFEANEKVAMKALTEAGDLRMQKTQLEEMLREANKELQATREDYEVKLLELSNLLDLRTKMLLENDNKCKQLESQIKHEEKVVGALSQEILVLKAQVERFTTENNLFAQQAEEGENSKTLPEPHNLKEIENMREKIKSLQVQINSKVAALETSTNLSLEKEKDLQKKIEELEITTKELNQNSSKSCAQPSEKAEGQTGEIASSGRTLPSEVLTELTSLKERNNSMESELKEMQERYSEISLKFAEVEGERQQLVMTVRNLKNANKSK